MRYIRKKKNFNSRYFPIEKDIVIIIRAEGENEEAALFAENIFYMYSSFAQKKKWKLEILNIKNKNSGGIEIIIFSIRGRHVYDSLQYETGVHRVQCVPKNQNSGKIQTSTITVAVFPDSNENTLNMDIVTNLQNQLNQDNFQERIRTYNFPQNRLTDHRISFTLYTLDLIMQGELEELINALKSRLNKKSNNFY